MAFSDGEDTVVIAGADLLIVPPNVAQMVREQVRKETGLPGKSIYVGASHTHDSAGAWGPGVAAAVTGGKYDPKIPPLLAAGFSDAIIEAYRSLEPGKIAVGSIAAPQFIRNRAHDDVVADDLEENDVACAAEGNDHFARATVAQFCPTA